MKILVLCAKEDEDTKINAAIDAIESLGFVVEPITGIENKGDGTEE